MDAVVALDQRRPKLPKVSGRTPLGPRVPLLLLLVHFLTIGLLPSLRQPLHQSVGMVSDLVKLPRPVNDIQERPEIMTIVIWVLEYCKPLESHRGSTLLTYALI